MKTYSETFYSNTKNKTDHENYNLDQTFKEPYSQTI